MFILLRFYLLSRQSGCIFIIIMLLLVFVRDKLCLYQASAKSHTIACLCLFKYLYIYARHGYTIYESNKWLVQIGTV
jgi:hypothetical protein